jgi:hypothetical protein
MVILKPIMAGVVHMDGSTTRMTMAMKMVAEELMSDMHIKHDELIKVDGGLWP